MIGRLAGTLVEKAPPRIVLDVHGVGYEVEVPMSTFYHLPGLGQPSTLLTHLVVREDAHILYGFLTDGERVAFRELVRVSGIGPRTALSVLSGLSVEELATAVAEQSAVRLVKVPGIGKKTAERLLLELKGRMGLNLAATVGAAPVGSRDDVLQALVALGYSDKEALEAVKRLPTELSTSEAIKQALKGLTR